MTEEAATVTFELDESQALALAQFVKRIHFSDIEKQAANTGEACAMRDAIERLQRGLEDVGYSPR